MIWNSAQKICLSFSSSANLFNHYLYQFKFMIYLFYILGYNAILLYFLAQISPALATRSSFSRLLCPLIIPINVGFSFLTLSYFLALPDTLGLSCIFLVSGLELAISPRNPASFC